MNIREVSQIFEGLWLTASLLLRHLPVSAVADLAVLLYQVWVVCRGNARTGRSKKRERKVDVNLNIIFISMIS